MAHGCQRVARPNGGITRTTTLVLAALTLLPAAADAQSLGTFRWQLQPYCNVVTLAVTQVGGIYRVEGTDDRCGAAQSRVRHRHRLPQSGRLDRHRPQHRRGAGRADAAGVGDPRAGDAEWHVA